MEEFLVEPRLAPGGNDRPPRDVPRDERQRHVDPDREEERLPRHGEPADAEEEPSEHAVENEHRERVDRDHDEGVAVVPLREVTPHEHHRRARRDPEEDAAGEVAPPQRHLEHLHAAHDDDLAGAVDRARREIEPEGHLHMVDGLGADEPAECDAEKEERDRVHGERLHGPVHEKREPDGLRRPAGLEHVLKIDLHHDRVHHEEEAHGDGNGDDGRVVDADGETVEIDRDARRDPPEHDPQSDAEPDPDGEVPLEEPEPPRLLLNARLGRHGGHDSAERAARPIISPSRSSAE